MLRAVYEGIVFSHVTHVNKLLRNRERPKSVRLSGGAANSDVWVQIFADALQLPIDVIEDKELGAQGAAMGSRHCSGNLQRLSGCNETYSEDHQDNTAKTGICRYLQRKICGIPCGDRRTEWCVEVFQKLGKGETTE